MDLTCFTPVICKPERLTVTESWHRHIPFAFSLLDMLKPDVYVELGTHRGDSYCAICQGVVHQSLATRCYAVDTWQGDEHAGAYDSDVLDDLITWHEPRFARFSNLMRMTFDEAVEHFPDSSIDLLHIDGLHTYEAVKHDFESWLPKLSERAVVLFHDTNVRHGDFGVWRFWHEISEQFPAFEFPFGFGLGVLAVGGQAPEKVLQFIEHAQKNPQQVVDFFFRYGNATELHKSRAQVRGLQQRVEGVERQLHHALQVLDERDLQLSNLQQELDVIRARNAEADQLRAALQLAEARFKQVVESKPWRLRNWFMHLMGQTKRVID